MKVQKSFKYFSIGVHSAACLAHLITATVFVTSRDAADNFRALPIISIDSGEPPYRPDDINATAVFEISPLLIIVLIEYITAAFELVYVATIIWGKWYYPSCPPFEEWTANEARWVEYMITATLGTLSQAVGVGAATFSNFLILTLTGKELRSLQNTQLCWVWFIVACLLFVC